MHTHSCGCFFDLFYLVNDEITTRMTVFYIKDSFDLKQFIEKGCLPIFTFTFLIFTAQAKIDNDTAEKKVSDLGFIFINVLSLC